MVPREIASFTSKRFLPGTQPSWMASFHEAPFLRTPMITLRPLSRRLRPWPWPGVCQSGVRASIHTVVRLTLGSVTDQRKSVILEVLLIVGRKKKPPNCLVSIPSASPLSRCATYLDLLQRPVRTLYSRTISKHSQRLNRIPIALTVDGLLCSSKVNGPNTPSLVSQARNSSNSSPNGSSSNHEAALLDDGDNLAGEV